MPDTRVLFLHHSTGHCLWNGGVPAWFARYNQETGSRVTIAEQPFPKAEPYGWSNYPYDYWNLWVEHAGDRPFQEEPTLEMLAPPHDLIVWKHCYPVSHVQPDSGAPDIRSPEKRLENYRLQYLALRTKMRAFPQTRFLVWTAAALVRANTGEAEARRAKAFVDWTVDVWDEPGDNIFVWDFHALETDGGLYLRDDYAASPTDSHPNEAFSRRAAPLFCQRMVDVLDGEGDRTSRTGG